MNENERIDEEISKLRTYGESLGDECPLWLSAMGEADWEAERYLRCPDGETYASRWQDKTKTERIV